MELLFLHLGPIVQCLSKAFIFASKCSPHLRHFVFAARALSEKFLLSMFELHGQSRFFNIEFRYPLQFTGKAKEGECSDEPFGGIELLPADTIAVIKLKDVVVIVIPLAISKEGENIVVAGGVLVRIWTAPPNMSQ